MPKVLVVYATGRGKTKEIANLIAEGISSAGAEAKVMDARNIKNVSEIKGYDGYVFGSATYHGEMMDAMKKLLFMAEQAKLEGKMGGAFGAYGWSGEAPERIYDTMKHIFKMEMVGNSLRVKTDSSGGDALLARAYGRGIGQKIKA